MQKPPQILVNVVAAVGSQLVQLADQIRAVLHLKRRNQAVLVTARIRLVTGDTLLVKDAAPQRHVSAVAGFCREIARHPAYIAGEISQGLRSAYAPPRNHTMH